MSRREVLGEGVLQSLSAFLCSKSIPVGAESSDAAQRFLSKALKYPAMKPKLRCYQKRPGRVVKFRWLGRRQTVGEAMDSLWSLERLTAAIWWNTISSSFSRSLMLWERRKLLKALSRLAYHSSGHHKSCQG